MEWREIQGAEGYYVSDNGQVKGLDLARYYRCSVSTISKIHVGVNYPHISA